MSFGQKREEEWEEEGGRAACWHHDAGSKWYGRRPRGREERRSAEKGVVHNLRIQNLPLDLWTRPPSPHLTFVT